MLLEPLYEQDFDAFSYRFRLYCSAQDAWEKSFILARRLGSGPCYCTFALIAEPF